MTPDATATSGDASSVDPVPTVDIVVPVHNEESTSNRACAGCSATWTRAVRRPASPSPTMPARTRRPDSPPAGPRVRRGRRRPPAMKGPRSALKYVWSASTAAGARLHGRRPLDRPERAASTGRPAAERALRHGDRDPAQPRGAGAARSSKREVISRGYNLLLRGTLGAGFGDAQCGFKAVRARGCRGCFPGSRTTAGSSTPSCSCWPTGQGCGSTRSPVDWVDDADSRVDVVADGRDDLRGIARLGWSLCCAAGSRCQVFAMRLAVPDETASRGGSARSP